MTTTDIRTTLTEVARAAAVPDVDQLAFQGRVRAARRRRTTTRTLTAVTAAGVAAAVALVGLRMVGTDAATELSPSQGASAAVEALPDINWFVVDGKLVALDSSGIIHEPRYPAESVVGYTSEVVYGLDKDSRLFAYEVTDYDPEAGFFAMEAGEGPVEGPLERDIVSGPVGSASLSGDGRYLGWIEGQDPQHLTARLYDLKAGQVAIELPVAEPVSLVGAGQAGLLLMKGEQLVLVDSNSETAVGRSGEGWSAALQMTTVSVPLDDGRTRLYDVGDAAGAGAPRVTHTLEGVGVVAPYGDHVAAIRGPRDEPGSYVSVWSTGAGYQRVTGLEGVPVHIRWADEQSFFVQTSSPAGDIVHGCGLDRRCAPLPLEGNVQLYE